MKFWKSHFVFNKSERNGIFLLLILIIILQGVYFLNPFANKQTNLTTEEITEISKFQKSLDSLKVVQNKQNDTIYPFNPNYLSDYKGYKLGLSLEETDRLLAYRKTGKFINSPEEFQSVTQISDSTLNKIRPYFKFPEFIKKLEVKKSISSTYKIDLNTAKVEDLKKVNGIGDQLANRIVNYKNKIGGYQSLIQLKDIYGLSIRARENLLRYLNPIEPTVEKKDLNTIGLIQLSELPYFNYEIARAVIDYRNLHQGIPNFDILLKIDGFPDDKIDRIQLYLYLN